MQITTDYIYARNTVWSNYKSSAVAEMGEGLATIDMGQKVGGLLCPSPQGSQLGPHLTHSHLS